MERNEGLLIKKSDRIASMIYVYLIEEGGILDKFGDPEEIDREDLKEEMKAYKEEFSVENDEVWDIIVDKVLALLNNNNKTQHIKSGVNY